MLQHWSCRVKVYTLTVDRSQRSRAHSPEFAAELLLRAPAVVSRLDEFGAARVRRKG